VNGIPESTPNYRDLFRRAAIYADKMMVGFARRLRHSRANGLAGDDGTAAIGSLSVQLVYYRGPSECRASKWISQPEHLSGLMEKIACRMGHTQLGKVLAHARREAELLKVQALIFVGDAFEENPNKLSHDAGELRRLSVPAFMFQEGHNRDVEQVFRGIARLTHGAYCRFDPGAARQLAELLRAVAVYAAGGMTALAARRDAGAVKLLSQMK
jgi:hypothetical protein